MISKLTIWIAQWKKQIWWVFLLFLFSMYLFLNQHRILSEIPTSLDFVIVILWLILLLYPLFSEIDIAGFKLKKEIEILRTDLKDQILTLRSEIQNTANFQNINLVGYPLPAPDPKLKQLQTEFLRYLESSKKGSDDTHGDLETLIEIPERNVVLFKIRGTIESELLRILKERVDGDWNKKPLGIGQMIRILENNELIDFNFYRLILEVSSVCNQAVHNRPISNEQYDFVTRLSPDIIQRLKDI